MYPKDKNNPIIPKHGASSNQLYSILLGYKILQLYKKQCCSLTIQLFCVASLSPLLPVLFFFLLQTYRVQKLLRETINNHLLYTVEYSNYIWQLIIL